MNDTAFDSSWARTLRKSPVTCLLCGLCGLTFVLQLWKGHVDSSGIGYPGYVDGFELFGGQYWGLLTSFFLHANPLHIAFNVYWLYLLGAGLEQVLGWKRYLLFWLAATSVSSLMEVVVSGDMGVGASGFVYALFGFIWVGSRHEPDLARLLDQRTVSLFMIWLVACIFLTVTGLDAIANGAHVGGLIYGALCAYAFLVHNTPGWKGATGVVTLLFFLPLLYAPWLSSWNLAAGAQAYDHEKYARALSYLEKVDLPEYAVYTMELKAGSLSSLNRPSEAAAVYRDLLSAHKEDELSNPGYTYNEYAWILATSPDDKVRNPEEAIHYSQLACEKDKYEDSNDLDTLASAYASANQFADAVTWEEKAIHANRDAHVADELEARLKLFQSQKPYRETDSKSTGTGT